MADDQLTVKSPQGTLHVMPAANFQEAKKLGFSIPSNDEIKEFNDKIQYGDQPLKTFGEAAAGTATFGASRELENITGLSTPEAQAARAKYNPISNIAGEIAGVVTPLGAESLAGKAGMEAIGAARYLNPVARVAEAGGAAGEAAASLVPQGLSSVASAGAAGATEGMFYGAGQTLNEHALGDPDVNGEKLLSNIGYGSLLGGAIGSGFGTAEYLVPKAVNGAQEYLAKAKSALMGGDEEVGVLGKAYAKASSFVSGKPEEAILDALRSRNKLLEDPMAREEAASKFSSALQDHFSQLNTALKSANAEARDEEIKGLLSEMPVGPAKEQSSQVFNTVNNAIKEMTEHAPIYQGSALYKLNGLKDEFLKMASGAENASGIYDSINWLKKKIDEKFPIWGKNLPPEWKDTANLLRGVRSELKANLENESIWGETAARQSAFNDAQNQFFTTINNKNAFAKAFLGKSVTKTGQVIAEVNPSKVKTFLSQIDTLRSEAKAHALDDFFSSSTNLLNEIEKTYKNAPSKTFDKESIGDLIQKNKEVSAKATEQASLQKNLNALNAGGHNVYLGENAAAAATLFHPALGAAIEGINILRNPGLTIQRLVKIGEATRKATDAVSKGAKAVFKAGVKGGEVLSGYAGAKLAEDNHDKREDRISQFVNNPEHTINHLGNVTEGLYQSAPQITSSLHASAARASQFLSSKLPTRPNDPLDEKMPISKSQIAQFNRYYDTVENPMGVMKNIKGAMVSPEQIETLNVVYPKLYQEMKSKLIEEVARHVGVVGSPIPYKTKLGLSQFLGEPIDSNFKPQSIMANQLTMNIENQRQAQQDSLATKPSKVGMRKIESSKRAGIDHGSIES